MRFRLLANRPGSWLAVLAVLVAFVAYGYFRYKDGSGDDLASSYVGSRLLSEGLGSHLFHYDPVSFAEIGEDDTWAVVAQQGKFYGFLHPYVQTPLWAWLLQPLCRSISFWLFNRLFMLLALLSFAGALWLTARYWAPSFFNPYAMAVTVLCLALSQPFDYAMTLNQTHMLFVFFTLAALVLAEKDRPVEAGLLLACAAAIKITPGLLVVYWLITGRWKAALSTVAWSAAMWLGTVVAVGPGLMAAYVANLHRISRVLLVSENNQSFAAWIMARFYPGEVLDMNIFLLPAVVRISGSVLMVAFTVWGGWMDRGRTESGNEQAPLGAMVAMIAATVFAPIAWTHYAVVLVMPLMMLTHLCRAGVGRWWMWLLLLLAAVLNYRPLATDVVHWLTGPVAIVRGQFYACLLTMAALIAMARRRSDLVPLDATQAMQRITA